MFGHVSYCLMYFPFMTRHFPILSHTQWHASHQVTQHSWLDIRPRGMSLDPKLRHFLYKTNSNALMRHYFLNRSARIHAILDSNVFLERVTRILKVCLRKESLVPYHFVFLR